MKKQLIALTLLTALLAACGENTKTEEWYVSHPEELKKEVEKCNTKSLEEILKDPHCLAVQKAREKAFYEHEDNAPLPTFDINKFK